MSNLNPLLGWAVWASLNSHNDLELILLKGHLYIEGALDSLLVKNDIKEYKNFSFHRKVSFLKQIKTNNKNETDLIISVLYDLNRLRNKLAHEYKFDIRNGELESWSLIVLENFEGNKFTKYTYRTKITHAFSTLAKSLLELME